MFREADVPRLWQLGPPALFARKFATTPALDMALHARLSASPNALRTAKARAEKRAATAKSGGASNSEQSQHRRLRSNPLAMSKRNGAAEVHG